MPWKLKNKFLFFSSLHSALQTTLLTVYLLHCGTSYSLWTCPLQNTLLIVDLLHRGPPYSLWTFSTAEHPSHLEPVPPLNTILTEDLLTRDQCHCETTYSPWTCPPWNTLLNSELPYSPWTYPMWNTLLPQGKKTLVKKLYLIAYNKRTLQLID